MAGFVAVVFKLPFSLFPVNVVMEVQHAADYKKLEKNPTCLCPLKT